MFQQLTFTLSGKDAKDLQVYWGTDVEATISSFNSKIDMVKVKTSISQGVTSYSSKEPYGDSITADIGTNLLMEVNTASSTDENKVKYAQLDITIQYSEAYTK